MNARDEIIGTVEPRIDGRGNVIGTATSVDDLYRPDMLRVGRPGSSCADARILSSALSAARALPGTKAVITAADLPANPTALAVSDESGLPPDNVRYIVSAFPSVPGDHP